MGRVKTSHVLIFLYSRTSNADRSNHNKHRVTGAGRALRILVACASYPPARSGYAQVASHLVQEFRGAGHEVILITEKQGCHRVARATVLNSSGRATIQRGADIVQVIGPTPLFTEQVTLAAARHQIPVFYYIHAFAGIGTYHQGALFRLVDSVYRATYYQQALRRVHSATSSTQDFADGFRHYRGAWTIIPNGVSDPCIDTGQLPPLPAEAALHPELRVLFVGQLRPYKAADLLIRGVAEALRGGKDLRLTVVGDGPMRLGLEQLVDELGMRPAVVFKGPLSDSDLHTEYLSNDLLALPSVEGESFGIVLLEARLHGLIVLASDLPGVREVVHQVGGVLVPPGDPHAIAEALRKTGPLEPSRRVFNAEVAARYSWKSVASSYLDLYRKVLTH